MDKRERIPISAGFYITFSKDGRSLSAGREESQVLPQVMFWLGMHDGDENYQLVEKWVEQKKKQVEEDVREHKIRLKREELSDSVDRAARESGLRDRRLIELVRAQTFKTNGISDA
jgi:hypothetical protein